MNETSSASGFDLDVVLIVVGMLLIAAMYAWMMRRARPMLSVERDGLEVDGRKLPFSEVESVSYSRGSMGVLLRVTTRHGLLAFREDQLIQHPDDVRRKLVSGAGLMRAAEVEIPKGLVHDPGDIYEEWRRPTPEEFAAFTQGTTRTLAPRPASTKTPTKETTKKAAVGLTALALLLAKFGKALLVGLKFIFGSAKLGGLLPTALSMLASVWVYALLWGWWFAVGFVLLLLLHELGHATVIKAKGLRTSPIVFLPFIGAAIAIKDQFRDASVEAEMAWGGPAIGALAASACYLVFVATGNEFFLHLAYVGFLLNLFNLLPISPLDGGRVVAAISTWLWVPGLLLGGFLAMKIGHPILIVIVALGALRAFTDWKRRRHGDASAYYDMPLRYRGLMSAAYFGLVGFLGWMTYHAHAVAQAARDAG